MTWSMCGLPPWSLCVLDTSLVATPRAPPHAGPLPRRLGVTAARDLTLPGLVELFRPPDPRCPCPVQPSQRTGRKCQYTGRSAPDRPDIAHGDVRRISFDDSRVHAFGHESLGGWWNCMVLRGNHVPRPDRF